MTTNLAHALASLDRLEDVARHLREAIGQVESAVDSDPEARGMRLAAMVEAARLVKKSGDEACYFLTAEALDEGVEPAVLDLPSF